MLRVVVTLHNALSNAREQSRPSVSCLELLAAGFLDSVGKRSEREECVFLCYYLSGHFRLSSSLDTQQTVLRLDSTWTLRTQDIEKAVQEGFPCDTKEALGEFLELVRVAEENVPELLDSVGFPARYQQMIGESLAVMSKYDHTSLVGEDLESLESEVTYVKEIQGLCEQAQSYFPALEEAAHECSSSLEGACYELTEERDRLQAEQEAEEHEIAEYQHRMAEERYLAQLKGARAHSATDGAVQASSPPRASMPESPTRSRGSVSEILDDL